MLVGASAGVSVYKEDTQKADGVLPWLPCLYLTLCVCVIDSYNYIFILYYEGGTLVAVLLVALSYLKRIDLRPNTVQ